MKTICPPSYHQNGFLVNHALGQMMYGWYDLLLFSTIYLSIYLCIKLLWKGHFLSKDSGCFSETNFLGN